MKILKNLPRNFCCLKKVQATKVWGLKIFATPCNPPPSTHIFGVRSIFNQFCTPNGLTKILPLRNFCPHRPIEGRCQKFLAIFWQYYARLKFWSFFQKNPSNIYEDRWGGRLPVRKCNHLSFGSPCTFLQTWYYFIKITSLRPGVLS